MKIEHNKDYYITLRDRVQESPNPHFNQIELDLNRTFDVGQAGQGELIGPLRRVLSTFVKRNHTIGYC